MYLVRWNEFQNLLIVISNEYNNTYTGTYIIDVEKLSSKNKSGIMNGITWLGMHIVRRNCMETLK